MRKFAFILMGTHYDPETHRARFETGDQLTDIRTVRDYEQAKALVGQLAGEGYGALELCGAFREEKCRELIELTGGKIPIGYVTNIPGQEKLVEDFFVHKKG